MKIESYTSCGMIKFGMLDKEVLEQLGKPLNTRSNGDEELEYHYKDFIIRYDEKKSVREMTLFPSDSDSIEINGVLLDWSNEMLTLLCKQDGQPFEAFGYVVLYNLGVALVDFYPSDNFSERTISVFRMGDYDDFKADMAPFSNY